MAAQDVEQGGVNWINLAQNRDGQQAVVDAAMKLRGSVKCGEFLDWLRTGQLLKKESAAWRKLVTARYIALYQSS